MDKCGLLSTGLCQPKSGERINFICSYFYRHPMMAKWPVGHNWFFMKLELVQVWLQDWFGGVSLIQLEDYFKATPFWDGILLFCHKFQVERITKSLYKYSNTLSISLFPHLQWPHGNSQGFLFCKWMYYYLQARKIWWSKTLQLTLKKNNAVDYILFINTDLNISFVCIQMPVLFAEKNKWM